MKKIKVFASFLKLSDAKKEAQKQTKQLANGFNDYSNAKVEIINAQKLWKTNNWTCKNPYGLPYPKENDFLVCITYTVAQVAQPVSNPTKPKLKKHTENEAIDLQFFNTKINTKQMGIAIGRMLPFLSTRLPLTLNQLKCAS